MPYPQSNHTISILAQNNLSDASLDLCTGQPYAVACDWSHLHGSLGSLAYTNSIALDIVMRFSCYCYGFFKAFVLFTLNIIDVLKEFKITYYFSPSSHFI